MLFPSVRRGAAIAAALLMLSPSGTDAAAPPSRRGLTKTKAKAEFMRAMSASAGAKRRRTAKANLRKNLAARARPMPESMRAEFEAAGAAKDNRPALAHRQRRLEDGDEDGDGDEEEEDQYGFDVSEYSFKYAGCSAVATYSDDMAEDEDFGSVVMTKRFVVFRLCPTAYCSDDYKYGCGGGYGEYVVDMDEYLELMAQYQEDRLERYCEYCDQCMNPEEDDEEEERGRRERRRLDDEEEAEEEEEDENAEEEEADAEEEAADDDNAAAQYCDDYEACYNYADVCGEDGDENDDGQEEVDIRDFFECQQVDANNGNNNKEFFVGPHCSYDKKTITVGLYADEYCSDYIGNDYDIGNVLGLYIDDDALADYYSEDCVTCNGADLPYQEEDENDENGDGDEEVEINELCENMFQEAGKCHRYMEDVDEDAYGENQADNEDTVCSFIQNVVTGQYDEYGYIYLSADDYSKDNKSNQYATMNAEVTIGQIFGLLLSALACIILIIWACFLHRKLTRRAPWRPRKAGESNKKAGKLSRNNSGILLGRSRSGGSYQGGQMT